MSHRTMQAPEKIITLSSARLTARERVWLPLEYIRTVGPLRQVTAGGLRAALIGLHASDPTHRAVSRLDRNQARWVRMSAPDFAAYSQDAVTEVREGPAAEPDRMSRRLLAEPRGHHPVRILVGGGYVAIKVAHAYGDAGPVNDLVRELVKAAAEERPAHFAPSPPSRPALAKALWHQIGRHPDRWTSVLRIVRPPAGEPLNPDNSRAWQPDITVEAARSADVLAKMRDWRDSHAPGVTTSAITFAAFSVALRRVGLRPVETGAVFVADARRYLPAGTVVDGNFCWGPYVTPVDLTDPRSVHTALKAELSSGRMLTMMALREARIATSRIEGLPAPYPTRARRDPAPELTFSNQGRHDILADLPWAAGYDGRVNLSVPTRGHPEGITLTTSEMGGVLHLEATFHGSTYDPGLLATALGMVCADPAALLMATL